ncbi:MAG: hypothetical protein K6E83_00465 [Clostridium sp.]|nr:hypothetical protein [Clostridium sp.]
MLKTDVNEYETLQVRQESYGVPAERNHGMPPAGITLHKKYFSPDEADSFVDWMMELGIRC